LATNKDKARWLPPIGFEFNLGPYVFRVTYVNAGRMRFTAKLLGMLEEAHSSQLTAKETEEGGDPPSLL